MRQGWSATCVVNCRADGPPAAPRPAPPPQLTAVHGARHPQPLPVTMLSKHDELLLKDIQLQPRWLIVLYVALGVAASTAGLAMLDWGLEAICCVGGGFLVALGAEKVVTRCIRDAAVHTIASKVNPHGHGQNKER